MDKIRKPENSESLDLEKSFEDYREAYENKEAEVHND